MPETERGIILLTGICRVVLHPGDSDYGLSFVACIAPLTSKCTIIKYKYNNKYTQEHSLEPIIHNQDLNA